MSFRGSSSWATFSAGTGALAGRKLEMEKFTLSPVLPYDIKASTVAA